MALPTRAAWAAMANEGEWKGLLGDESEFIARMLGGALTTELTIASGVVTATGAIHSIDTEGEVTTGDDLDRIDVTALDAGGLIAIYLESAARPLTIRHEQGGEGQLSLMRGESLTLKSDQAIALFRIDKAATPDTLREVGRVALPSTVTAHTATASLRHGGDNEIDTNAGATGVISLTLPEAIAGRRRIFSVEAAFNMDVIPKGANTIFDGVTERSTGVKNATVGSVLDLICTVAGTWRFGNSFGAWVAV